jgi:hypothetical protein
VWRSSLVLTCRQRLDHGQRPTVGAAGRLWTTSRVATSRVFSTFKQEPRDRGRTSRQPSHPSVLHGPKVVVPNRAYFLFLESMSDFGDWARLIGADVSAIDQLLADPRLDVVPADPRQDQPSYRW